MQTLLKIIRNYLTNVKALQFFHLLRQGTAILIAILLTKSSLNTNEIGTYEMLLFVGYVASFFWVSGFVQGLLTTYPKLSEVEKKEFLVNTYLVFLAISVLIFLAFLLFSGGLLGLLLGRGSLDYLSLFLLFLLVNMPTFLLENFYLLKNNPMGIFWFGIFSFGLQLIAIALPVFLGFGLLWSFYSLVFLAFLKHLWLLYFLWENGSFRLRGDLIKQWLKISSPLILYALIGGLNQTFDNWLVGFNFDGDEAFFAIFRYGARELPLAMALANAFSTSMLPEVAMNLQFSLKIIKEKSVKLLHLLFPISIVAMLSSSFLFPLVFNESFSDSAIIFNVFLLVIISRLIFPQTILIGLGENKMVLLFSIIELGFNIALSFVFVQHWGLAGIAMGTVIAFFMEKLMMAIFLYTRFKISPGQYCHLNIFAVYSVLLLTSFLVSTVYF